VAIEHLSALNMYTVPTCEACLRIDALPVRCSKSSPRWFDLERRRAAANALKQALDTTAATSLAQREAAEEDHQRLKREHEEVMRAGYAAKRNALQESARLSALGTEDATDEQIERAEQLGRRARVLHLDHDNGMRATQRRYQRLAFGMGLVADDLRGHLRFLPGPKTRLTDPRAVDGGATLLHGAASPRIPPVEGRSAPWRQCSPTLRSRRSSPPSRPCPCSPTPAAATSRSRLGSVRARIAHHRSEEARDQRATHRNARPPPRRDDREAEVDGRAPRVELLRLA
jgi:hypothetical protein